MSNELDKFRGSSETRWPSALNPLSPSGGDRKALSRYISEYLSELEKTDSELLSQRRQTSTTPPSKWESAPSKLPMNRKEYIRRQNALFKELTGSSSWTERSAIQTAQDLRNKQLMTTLELYMAALDEKVYMSADHTRAMIGVRDQALRDEYDKLVAEFDSDESKEKKIYRMIVELRDMYRDLWMQHSQLSNQRDQLEQEMSTLRHDHALQLAKVFRLQYATYSLGQKLVDAQELKLERDELAEEVQRQKREDLVSQSTIDALRQKTAAQAKIIEIFNSGKKNEPKEVKELDQRLIFLYEELAKLKANEAYVKEHPDNPQEPTETLRQALSLLEIANEDKDKRVASLIESFLHQYRTRETELLTQIQRLSKEKQIILARCEKLESENADANADLSYLEHRTLSLVLMLKSVRASLDEHERAKSPSNDDNDDTKN